MNVNIATNETYNITLEGETSTLRWVMVNPISGIEPSDLNFNRSKCDVSFDQTGKCDLEFRLLDLQDLSIIETATYSITIT